MYGAIYFQISNIERLGITKLTSALGDEQFKKKDVFTKIFGDDLTVKLNSIV